jgi:hypothetical protein
MRAARAKRRWYDRAGMDVDSASPVALRREALAAALAPFRTDEAPPPAPPEPRARRWPLPPPRPVIDGPTALRPEALERVLTTLAHRAQS